MTQTDLIDLFNANEPDLRRMAPLDDFYENSVGGRLRITGLSGSSLSLALAPLFSELKQNQLFVFPDKESSAFFYHDIEKMLDDANQPIERKKVHYFPASYRRPYEPEAVDNANIKLRSEIINKLLYAERKSVIVTYPEAITEKLTSTKLLKQNSFTIKRGDALSIDDFVNFLYEAQYRQDDFVFEPGQFAWRGALFDVFSFSEEYGMITVYDYDHV